MRARKTRPLKISRNLRSKNPRIQLRKRDTRSIRRRKRTSVGMMIAKEVVTKDTEVSLVQSRQYVLESCWASWR